ncbi:MAG: ComEC/Rec2 family competence protein [Rhabdochlamydiaceae bacterium]|nr:ComEC/Rec2 family competence protein [Rhabdochlamydiaceae bacterium]
MSPLFFYGLCLLLGICTQIQFHLIYLFVFALLLWKVRLIPGILMFVFGFGYAALTVTLPVLPEEGIEGSGTFIPESVSYTHSPFGTSYITKGSLNFKTDESHWKRIPCQIYTPLHKARPPGNRTSKIEGKLLPKTFPHYVLKPTHIEPQNGTFSLAQWRFQVKDWVRYQFSKLFPSPTAASFLLSMVTGDIDDRLMSLQFNRLGLLHLLGVSGFQFSLLALLLGAAFRVLIPGTKGTFILMALLTLYAFILGNSPPIERAWIGVMLYAIARLKGFQISPLNALGAALIFELLLDPLVYYQLGFQFSFLCTAAIFIVYPPLRKLFSYYLPNRTLSETRALSLLDRAGHIVTFFCREALALNLAIHLVSLPLIFFHFHKFPLLSLVYNLFLPPVVSLAYFLLIVGFMIPPFLKLAGLITDGMLHVATNPPTLFDFQWRMPSFTLSWALVTLILMFVLFHERSRLLDRILRR